jgi:hypothetical protein
LSADRSIKATALDFPFSIPSLLLNDAAFAQRMNQKAFCTRENWLKYVGTQLRLEFNDDRASAELHDLERFGPWRDKKFWQRRSTDSATNGSAPLKHKFQNVFAMTIAGASLLSRLGSNGYRTLLDTTDAPAGQCVFETYPRAVADRIGFLGSYKSQAAQCLNRALEYLDHQGIRLDFDNQVRHFCLEYRTSANDPNGADAFLCLVAAICFYEGMVELCDGGASAATLKEEGAIIVPSRCR